MRKMGRFYFPGPVLERSEGMGKEIIRTVPFLRRTATTF